MASSSSSSSSSLSSLSSPSFFIVLLSSALCTTTDAAPISTTHTISRRSSKSTQIGVNVSITLSIILCAVLFFYLGMRRGKYGSWFRIPKTSSLKTTSTPRTWTWNWAQLRTKSQSLRWPWQKKTTPVFELEATERRRRSNGRRSWLWERMRAEQGAPPPLPTHNPMVVSPITPIERSRNQIMEARRAEREKREQRGRAEQGQQQQQQQPQQQQQQQQHLEVDLNVYEMGSNTSRPGSSHPNLHPLPPSPTLTRHPSTKPQNWFLHWRFYFEQSSPSHKSAYLTDKPPAAPRRWFSVRSTLSRTNSRKTEANDVTFTPQSRWSKSTMSSVYELDNTEATPPPAYPEKAYWGRLSREGMDWHGLEFMKKMYEKRMSVWRAA